jgi:hypothetical protein
MEKSTILTNISDTLLQTGDIPVRLGPVDPTTKKPSILEAGKPRETRVFNGKTYGMEHALPGESNSRCLKRFEAVVPINFTNSNLMNIVGRNVCSTFFLIGIRRAIS